MLFTPLTLPCGAVLKNRIAKSAMSDSLGDGTGHPSSEQVRLYQRWAEGGLAVSIIGEVQSDPNFAEKPGNLVLDKASDRQLFRELARTGGAHGTGLWLQLGHAGALAYPPISTPKGPSALNLPGLVCEGFTLGEIQALPGLFARTADLTRHLGFGGVQIHAAHGFLLSQFLSPLFNKRDDSYGGSITNRARLLLESITAVRAAVGSGFPVAVKLNSSDLLDGGLSTDEALEVVAALDQTSVDLIDISGGTYFPGAANASDASGGGPYFVDFARRARAVTNKPLMVTGGFKTRDQAHEALTDGAADVIGLARALVLRPDLPKLWQANQLPAPVFPRFTETPEGGVTAWYTMRLTAIGSDAETDEIGALSDSIDVYESRDATRAQTWRRHFSQG